MNEGVHLTHLKFFWHIRRQTRQVTRQNTLVTCMLTLSVILSVLCFHWLFIFRVVVTYHRLGSPGCSMCYLSSGDQFVSRSLTMLSLLQMEFASPPPPPPPPILFQRGMTGRKPTVPSSSLCLMIFHSFCGLN